jgi:hypothetical protein
MTPLAASSASPQGPGAAGGDLAVALGAQRWPRTNPGNDLQPAGDGADEQLRSTMAEDEPRQRPSPRSPTGPPVSRPLNDGRGRTPATTRRRVTIPSPACESAQRWPRTNPATTLPATWSSSIPRFTAIPTLHAVKQALQGAGRQRSPSNCQESLKVRDRIKGSRVARAGGRNCGRDLPVH